jgi:molybdopterin/thiamine biosynthesis adenylyltransferase
MTSPDYWRQLDLVSAEQLAFPITVIGAGGIGSPLALALTKMGCRQLTLYDPDTVEAHNLPNQVYRLADVGEAKVTALAELLGQFADIEVDARQELVTEQALRGVVISAVDSMASRQHIWHGCVRYKAAVPLYVDARMGAQVCRVFTLNPTDPDEIEAYESTLYDDDEAAVDPCTAQAIIYNTFAVAALVANQVKRFACDEPLERDVIFDLATLTLLKGGEL